MKIGIIGGGASGMFLASMLNGYDVTLFEKNSKREEYSKQYLFYYYNNQKIRLYLES